ncbi:MAG TPA: DinB family protein [Vicinamibacterales bacterium]|nr:DinB family protein [Vicinamibacterales bacterium]
MAIAESMLPEFDRETATTRLLLERVPEGKADWQPHPKSMSLGQLAMHIANIPRWASVTLEGTAFDTNPPEGQRATTPPFQSGSLLLQAYDEGVSAARAMLARTSDADFMVPWTLKNAGRSMFSMPRATVFRSFILNHTVHHRGQLSVYLRLLDVPLPNIYGPTADS